MRSDGISVGGLQLLGIERPCFTSTEVQILTLTAGAQVFPALPHPLEPGGRGGAGSLRPHTPVA